MLRPRLQHIAAWLCLAVIAGATVDAHHAHVEPAGCEHAYNHMDGSEGGAADGGAHPLESCLTCRTGGPARLLPQAVACVELDALLPVVRAFDAALVEREGFASGNRSRAPPAASRRLSS